MLFLTIHSGIALPEVDSGLFGDHTDSYVRIIIDEKKGPRTASVKNDLNPKYEETFELPVAGQIGDIRIEVKDDDAVGRPDFVGKFTILSHEMLQGFDHRQFKLLKSDGNPTPTGHLVVSCRYQSHDDGAATQVYGAFEERRGCRVTLYQDAHHDPDHHMPQVMTSTGPREPTHCYLDMYNAICDAKHFIYITGWSIWTDLRLVRHADCMSLGELLKFKAEQEGVRVMLMQWDEALSVDNPIINRLISTTKAGMMATHDEETNKFFKGVRNVDCALVYRNGSGVSSHHGATNKLSKFLGWASPSALFTHHQKTIICDAPALDGSQRRRLLAFVGGLDLTDGRFDTPAHPLFNTMNTMHRPPGQDLDCIQHCIPNPDTSAGPREPWHDIHAKVEGQVAWDIMANFEQRWRRQVPSKRDRLVNLSSGQYAQAFIRPDEDVIRDHTHWNVQMLRSIDTHSAEFGGNSPGGAIERSIRDREAPHHNHGGCAIECSIYTRYLAAIEKAQRFIYIENQYFLGSSREWAGFDDHTNNIPCQHRIPLTIVNKILHHIRNGLPFCAYILLPLFPEGVPESGAVQEILHWQFLTVQFMYRRIAAELRSVQSPHSVLDYLQFFFIGNREPLQPGEIPKQTPTERQNLLVRTRRHMIYVHSKMMIVDDELIICGSANINQRSMAGDRDTEIAVAAYQPAFMGDNARGDVHHFRLSLWAEHTMLMEDSFLRPESLQCARRMRALAEHNWKAYIDPNPTLGMYAHLCTYPYTVDPQSGEIRAADDCPSGCFPDNEKWGATIVGSSQSGIPDLLST